MGDRTISLNAENRLSYFHQLIAQLKIAFSDIEWTVENFTSENAPAGIKTFKSAYLVGFCNTERFWDAYKRWWDKTGVFSLKEVRCRFIYYDWGLSTIDTSFILNINAISAIEGFSKTADEFHNFITSKKLIPFLCDFSISTSKFRQCSSQFASLIMFKGNAYEFDTFGVNLILFNGSKPKDSYTVSLEFMQNIFVRFTGNTNEAIEMENYFGFIADSGIDGQIAFIQQIEHLDKIKWLWRLATIYWGHANESSLRLQSYLTGFLSRKQDVEISELKDIQTQNMAYRLLLQEVAPEILCGNAMEYYVYMRVWKKWHGDEQIVKLEKMLSISESYFDDMSSIADEISQNKMNKILFWLNILLISTAIATIISTLDIKISEVNDFMLPPWVRTVLVSIPPLVFGVVLKYILNNNKRNI